MDTFWGPKTALFGVENRRIWPKIALCQARGTGLRAGDENREIFFRDFLIIFWRFFGLGGAPQDQKLDFWTIFRDFFSEIESDHKNFLEVEQDLQAGP